mmetsp:Transcript_39372/g.117835  ORF Transcript_39372/g.117835 Transcript_39372/m.117835 type:complete len:257 (-) Transcript_39372:161-931(-)
MAVRTRRLLGSCILAITAHKVLLSGAACPLSAGRSAWGAWQLGLCVWRWSRRTAGARQCRRSLLQPCLLRRQKPLDLFVLSSPGCLLLTPNLVHRTVQAVKLTLEAFMNLALGVDLAGDGLTRGTELVQLALYLGDPLGRLLQGRLLGLGLQLEIVVRGRGGCPSSLLLLAQTAEIQLQLSDLVRDLLAHVLVALRQLLNLLVDSSLQLRLLDAQFLQGLPYAAHLRDGVLQAADLGGDFYFRLVGLSEQPVVVFQ